MKKSNKVGVWRPAGGALLVGALAFAVGAYAAPRTTDKAASRDTTTTVRSDAALVTGSPEHLQAVVAGAGPTARLEIRPGPARVGAYPAGTTIVGNELAADVGNFRAWFEYRLEDWDPAGNGTDPADPGTVQIKFDGMGMLDADTSDPGPSVADDGDQADLLFPVIACANNAACVAPFGEAWARCELGFCKPSYADRLGVHPQSYCSDFGSGPCNQGDCATATANHNCFAITEGPRPDDGQSKYYASLVIDIPANAKGRYTIPLLVDETFLSSSTSPPVDIPTLAEVGFTVNIRTGSCCSDLTNPGGAVCEDGVLASECGDNETPPVVWTADKTCAQGCVECINDGGCDDGDACSTETCNVPLGVCVRGCKAGWNTATECCDPNTGTETPISDGDDCTADACSGGAAGACGAPEPGNGSATHAPAAGPCDDGNPCTVGDVCNGTQSQQDGGCTGNDVNAIACAQDSDCPQDPQGVNYACVDNNCFCTLTPNVRFVLNSSPKTCIGGFTPGAPCGADSDCPGGGTCDNHANGANCYDEGDKVSATVHVGSAGSPINGGQFLITYDPTCVKLLSINGLAPYSTTVYGPVPTVANANGSIFIAVGVNPFNNPAVNGPLGNVDMLALSFSKIGECNECDLCFASVNPQNTYLVDDEGQRVEIEGKCKTLRANGELTLDIPDNIKTNRDCDGPTAVETWDPPSASFSCGTASITCRGAHESGMPYGQADVMDGGEFPSGASSFCCYAVANDPCDATVGCPGAANDCAVGSDGKPVGCWTVQVNDETSLDVDVQFEPPITHDDAGGEMTRCIKFCLFADCAQDPVCFEDDVTFGGLYEFVGKSRSKVKIPGDQQWDCISAQDQLHTLRSCYNFGAGDCVGGQLNAEFKGDPRLGGNWLIGGNLDGFKKDIPNSQPSLDVIDILDFGHFVSQYGTTYPDNDTPCSVDGPNADINGDGDVTNADYAFLQKNFLVSSKECCCGPQTGAVLPAVAVTEISVDELRQLGLSDLVSADLNGDGLVNGADMDAFAQGARPNKAGNGRGGKGLRSGR
jgi:hypothetical protein